MPTRKVLLLNASYKEDFPVYPYAFIQVPAVARQVGIDVVCKDLLGIPQDGCSWRLMQTAPPASWRAYGGDGANRDWTVVLGQHYACVTDPPTAIACDYRPENVIDGVARIVGTTTHMWASDPARSLPQWIELAFPQPAQVTPCT